jgi:ATP-binding cassette, subfamily B, bacterial
MNTSNKRHSFRLTPLLRPHFRALAGGILAVIGEGIANLLEPWPIKLVIDNVVRSRPADGWLTRFIPFAPAADRLFILKVAAIGALLIACIGAICSYAEKYLTTSVGQWVMHDVRRTLYSQIQKLSLNYHDHKQTGDLISRATTDIDAIQSFITSGLLGALTDGLTLVGMVGVMFYLNWRFTLIALSVAPVLFGVVFSYTRRIKKAAREVRKKALGDSRDSGFRARGL